MGKVKWDQFFIIKYWFKTPHFGRFGNQPSADADILLTRSGTFPHSDEPAVLVAVPYDAARERQVVAEVVLGGAGNAEAGVALAVHRPDARQRSWVGGGDQNGEG